jgi:hypothetical protein
LNSVFGPRKQGTDPRDINLAEGVADIVEGLLNEFISPTNKSRATEDREPFYVWDWAVEVDPQFKTERSSVEVGQCTGDATEK